MTNLKKRERAKTNASLISMVQRFSDITIMFAGLWLVCEVSGLSFLYMHLLVALITLVVFQMLGGITDFYRSWRGVRAATEFALLLQNWTLSVIFSAGLVAFNNDFDTQLKIWLAWYGLTSIGLVVCRSCIRIGAGWLRNHGYNKRMGGNRRKRRVRVKQSGRMRRERLIRPGSVLKPVVPKGQAVFVIRKWRAA